MIFLSGMALRRAATALLRPRWQGVCETGWAQQAKGMAAERENQEGQAQPAQDPAFEEELGRSTGEERRELEGKAKGIDVYAEDWKWIYGEVRHLSCTRQGAMCGGRVSALSILFVTGGAQEPGTPDNPVQVTSSFDSRIVGATDPDDDMIVHWDEVKAGESPKKIGAEWFVLRKDEEEHH